MANVRRDRGDGSLRERPNGSWEGRYGYIDDATGKRVEKSVYAATKTEARRKLKELIKEIESRLEDDDEYIKPSELELGEWLDTWMNEYKKNSIRPATFSAYKNCIDVHIKPAIGMIELQKLRPDHVQKLLNDLSKGSKNRAPLAPWSVIKVKIVLSGALEQAIRNQIIPYNPVKATVPPKLEHKEIRILSKDEQMQFAQAVKGHRLEALYLLALATGMRRGEIMALTWDCIDWDKIEISVKGSVSRVKDPDSDVSQIRYAEPKTKKGRRQVPILPNMIPVLKAHKERQDAEKFLAGSAWNTKNLVFCSTVGTIIEPRRIGTTMDKITDAAGMERFTFHALRHTFATRMLEMNAPAKVVADILGHSDITLTLNTYSHVIGSTAHDQMEKINDLFEFDGIADDIGEEMDEQPQKLSLKQKIENAKSRVDSSAKDESAKTKCKNTHER